jgi:hypothetical protein
LWNEPIDSDDGEDDSEDEMIDEKTETVGPLISAESEGSLPILSPPNAHKESKPQFPDTKRPALSDSQPKQPKKQKTQDLPLNPPLTQSRVQMTLIQLYATTNTSQDKLFFIHENQKWFLVKVDWNKTKEYEAKNKGIYHIRWFIKNQDDSNKLPTCNCRFWPLIQRFLPNGTFGPVLMVKPAKWPSFKNTPQGMKYGWYQRKVDLSRQRLVGPFNFSKIDGISDRISSDIWTSLQEQAQLKGIDTSEINKISPLTPYKRNSQTP